MGKDAHLPVVDASPAVREEPAALVVDLEEALPFELATLVRIGSMRYVNIPL